MPIKAREAIRRLRKAGWLDIGEWNGDHKMMLNPETGKKVPVKVRFGGSSELSKNYARLLMKETGVNMF